MALEGRLVRREEAHLYDRAAPVTRLVTWPATKAGNKERARGGHRMCARAIVIAFRARAVDNHGPSPRKPANLLRNWHRASGNCDRLQLAP